ncbi:hypothetical protein L9F63_016483 [Diploptera punctata]|uniref:Uncharacterized protein n=1 Tax=Diploptera punctata TaxID=6984 RepID=A0AAD8EH91_DIPPU|nr:hypothetical protein L9F63_016483 [Diploptera punctata]
MKWVAVALMCLVVKLASADSQCDLGTGIPYDKEEIEGIGYIVYSSPNLFEQVHNIQVNFTLDDESYDVTYLQTVTDEEHPKYFEATWTITDDKDFREDIPGIPTFDAEYRLLALVRGSYMIFRGCPPAFDEREFTFVVTAEQCPDENVIKEAIDRLAMNFSSFFRDPNVKC